MSKLLLYALVEVIKTSGMKWSWRVLSTKLFALMNTTLILQSMTGFWVSWSNALLTMRWREMMILLWYDKFTHVLNISCCYVL
jgi:hypothetical protein